ncbi:MAG: hypothetical protein KGQ77_11585, partial [Betaproteobacteria bacterium]|nr:hypothetical protein [Betaproteobacteria bacterium]
RKSGRLMLLDGHRRHRACRLAQLSTLRVEIVVEPASAQAAYLKARRLNTERHGQSAFDDALALRNLLALGTYRTQAEYAQDTGLSIAAVSKLFAIGNLPESIQAYIADHEEIQNQRLLYELHLYCQAAGEEKALALLADHASALTSTMIERAREREVSGPVQRARSATRSFSFHGVQGRIQRFDNGGRLEVRVKGLPPEHLHRLEQQMVVWLQAQPDADAKVSAQATDSRGGDPTVVE